MAEPGSNSYLVVLQNRIDEMADQAGITGAARSSIDETLAALPRPFRRRLFMLLESLRAFSPDPAQRAAAEAIEERAARVWGDEAAEIMGEVWAEDAGRAGSARRIGRLRLS